MNKVGLIPARSGSKGVKNKNIRLLNGKPLIAYTIEAALSSKLLDRVIVSTDSESFAEIARSYGAEVPFLRPCEISEDNTPDLPVMQHLIEYLKNNEGYISEYLIYLRPTSPFKTGEMIDEALYKIMSSESHTGLRSVTPSEGVFHPYWMYKDVDGTLKSFIEGIKIEDYYRRQLLPPCFRLNGVVDIVRSENVKQNMLYGDRIAYYELTEEESLDIDNEFDFRLAEFMMKESYSK